VSHYKENIDINDGEEARMKRETWIEGERGLADQAYEV
jgi:hypothetical protein